MKTRISLLSLALFGAAAPAIFAGEPPASDSVTSGGDSSRWRFGLGYAPLLGLKADFTGLGNFQSSSAPQPTGGGRDYDYDNGFVHVDSSGNLGGQTWNWGYDDASQIDPSGAGSVSYTLTRSLSDASVDERNATESGVEAYGYFDMGAVRIPGVNLTNATWGLRTGVHYAHVNIGNSANLASSTSVLTDRFSLGGIIPPLAPFAGSFNGPGPLIGDSPDRSITPGASALVSGSRELDVHLTTLSFGSYLDIPLSPHFNMTLEGGFNAGIASGSYDYLSNTTIGTLGTRTSTGSESETSILPGVYLGMTGIYQINDDWAIQASGRYQYMDGYDVSANGSAASLSFDSAFVLSLGALYSF